MKDRILDKLKAKHLDFPKLYIASETWEEAIDLTIEEIQAEIDSLERKAPSLYYAQKHSEALNFRTGWLECLRVLRRNLELKAEPSAKSIDDILAEIKRRIAKNDCEWIEINACWKKCDIDHEERRDELTSLSEWIEPFSKKAPEKHEEVE